jgi:hypothetical protein
MLNVGVTPNYNILIGTIFTIERIIRTNSFVLRIVGKRMYGNWGSPRFAARKEEISQSVTKQ